MRGNCSPESISITRVPPICVVIVTMPGCSATTSPMTVASLPSGCFSLVGDVQRIEPKNLAGSFDLFADGKRVFIEPDAKLG